MKGIKLSTLKSKVCFINESRKSKGKLSFVEKIKYLYLISKYKFFGLEGFTDAQLDQLIELLNSKEITYRQAKLKLAEEKAMIAEKTNQKVAELASVSEENFDEKAVKEIVKDAKMDQEYVDETIQYVDNKLEGIEEIKEAISTEQEAREIENKVNEPDTEEVTAEKEISEEVPEEKTEQLETPKSEEIDIDSLGEKIISETEEATQDIQADEPVKEDSLTDLVEDETKMAEILNQEKTEKNIDNATIENTESKAEQSETDRLKDVFNKVLNEKGKFTKEGVVQLFDDFCNMMAITMNDITAAIQEEDKKVALEIIAKKDSEIKTKKSENELLENEKIVLNSELNAANSRISEKDDEIKKLKAEIEAKNAEIAKQKEEISTLNATVENKNTEIANLAIDNKNFKIALKTLMATKSAELDEELSTSKVK